VIKKLNKPIILTLFFFFLIFYYPIIFGGSSLWEDSLYFFYPYRFFIADQIANGNIPFWNPYIFGGMPIFEDLQAGILNPFNWIYNIIYLLSGDLSFHTYSIISIIYIFILGIFTAIGTSFFTNKKTTIIFISIISMFSTFISYHINHLSFIQTGATLPFATLAIIKFLEKRNIKYLIFFVIGLILSLFGGYVQYIFYYLVFLFVGFVAYFIYTREKKISFLIFISIFLSLLASAVIYIPAIDFQKEIKREKLSFEESSVGSLQPEDIFRIVNPKVFGIIKFNLDKDYPYWINQKEYYNFWETSIFIGIIPLIFLIFILIKEENKRLRNIYIITIFTIFILSLGKYTPLYFLIYKFIPGFDKFRNPGRFLYLFYLFSIILLSLRYDKITKDLKHASLKSINIVLGVLFFLIIAPLFLFKFPDSMAYSYALNSTIFEIIIFILMYSTLFLYRKNIINTSIFNILIIILTFFDLYHAGSFFAPANIDGDKFYGRDLNLSSLKNTEEKFRIKSRSGPYMIFRRNAGMILKLELLSGYNPFLLKDFYNFYFHIKNSAKILNAKYEITIDENSNSIYLKENKIYWPRFFTTNNIIFIENNKDIKDIIDSTFYKDIKVVIKEKDKKFVKKIENSINTINSNIKVLKYDINHHKYEITTPFNTLFVENDIYYKRIKAKVDGEKTHLIKVNDIQRGIFIPKGKHIIEIYYDKSLIVLSFVLSFVGFILIFIFFYYLEKRKIYEA